MGTMIGSTTCCPIDGLLRTLKRNWTIVWKKNGARQRLQKPVAMGAVSPIALSEIRQADAPPRNSKRYVGAERFPTNVVFGKRPAEAWYAVADHRGRLTARA